MPAPALDSVRPAFRAAAAAFVPETAAADAATWERLEEVVATALAARPPRLRRQILLFIRLLDLLALARYGKRLAALDSARRSRLLQRLGASRLLLVRRGVWGLRTLVQMGWYGQPEIQQRLGYRASISGWEARQ